MKDAWFGVSKWQKVEQRGSGKGLMCCYCRPPPRTQQETSSRPLLHSYNPLDMLLKPIKFDLWSIHNEVKLLKQPHSSVTTWATRALLLITKKLRHGMVVLNSN